MVCEPVFVGDIREREHSLPASIIVDTAVDIKQLFLEFQTAGVCFRLTLKKEPWGARTSLSWIPIATSSCFLDQPTKASLV
jgi:hypothetical protein